MDQLHVVVRDELWDRRRVDILKRLPATKVQEYIDYRGIFKHEQADYKFEIPNIDALIQRGKTELLGELFHFTHLDLVYVAQMKCVVKFSHVKLSLVRFSADDKKMVKQLPANIMVTIKQSESNTDDIVLTCNVKSSIERNSGYFLTFCNFTYVDRIQKSPTNSLVLHLYVRDAFDEIPTRVLRWKVDCSDMEITDELGVSPFFYADAEGFQVQIRLFLQGGKLAAEFIFLKRINVNANCQFLLQLTLINPRNPSLNVVHEFNFKEWYKPEFMHECSAIAPLVNVEHLLQFLNHNKQLMVKAKLTYF